MAARSPPSTSFSRSQPWNAVQGLGKPGHPSFVVPLTGNFALPNIRLFFVTWRVYGSPEHHYPVDRLPYRPVEGWGNALHMNLVTLATRKGLLMSWEHSSTRRVLTVVPVLIVGELFHTKGEIVNLGTNGDA